MTKPVDTRAQTNVNNCEVFFDTCIAGSNCDIDRIRCEIDEQWERNN